MSERNNSVAPLSLLDEMCNAEKLSIAQVSAKSFYSGPSERSMD